MCINLSMDHISTSELEVVGLRFAGIWAKAAKFVQAAVTEGRLQNPGCVRHRGYNEQKTWVLLLKSSISRGKKT